ncbi:MAG: BadF/BadG/BcrA/BcrD ATPase family protein [Flavobacteriaceae bacterium]
MGIPLAEPLFLGIDGGASRCRARLRDAVGNLLGEGASGPANISTDIARARASIMEAAESALTASGLRNEDLIRCHAGLGLAGAGSRHLQQRLVRKWAPFASIRVATDAYIAWLGAHGGEDGAVVILGTGSACYGQAGDRTHVIGGWGMEVSDEGGAAAIGRESLRRSIWAWDGRIATTPLAENLLAMFGGTPDALVAAARKATAADYAAYAPLVFQFAEQGDELGTAILRDAAGHAGLMIERLVAAGYSRIAMVGGIATPMTPWLPDGLASQLCAARSDAIDGAIMMVRQALR